MVYLWCDGVYIKAGLEKEKAVVLVVLAALSDGSKVVVSVSTGYRESTQSWSEVLRDLKRRGMGCPRLVIADGHLGIWGALRNVFPQADEQRCWNHRILNLLAKIPKRVHQSALLMLRQIPYAETRPGGSAPQAGLPALVPAERADPGGRADRSGLGSDGDVLRLP